MEIVRLSTVEMKPTDEGVVRVAEEGCVKGRSLEQRSRSGGFGRLKPDAGSNADRELSY